jgi:hypothetical protein
MNSCKNCYSWKMDHAQGHTYSLGSNTRSYALVTPQNTLPNYAQEKIKNEPLPLAFQITHEKTARRLVSTTEPFSHSYAQ